MVVQRGSLGFYSNSLEGILGGWTWENLRRGPYSRVLLHFYWLVSENFQKKFKPTASWLKFSVVVNKIVELVNFKTKIFNLAILQRKPFATESFRWSGFRWPTQVWQIWVRAWTKRSSDFPSSCSEKKTFEITEGERSFECNKEKLLVKKNMKDWNEISNFYFYLKNLKYLKS